MILAHIKRFIGLPLKEKEDMYLSARFREKIYLMSGETKWHYIEWLTALRKEWKLQEGHDGELNTAARNKSFDKFLLGKVGK